MRELQLAERGIGTRIAYLLLVAIMAVHFTLTYISAAQPFLDLMEYERGQAPLPYQARVLAGWLMLLVDELLPSRIETWLGGLASTRINIILAVLTTTCLILATIVQYYSIICITGRRRYAAGGSLVVIFMSYFAYVLSYEDRFLMPYDIVTLLIFGIAMLGLVAGSDALFLAALATATLSKETAVFLVLAFFLYRRREKRSMCHLLSVGTISILIFFAGRIWIYSKFGCYEPAGCRVFEFHLFQNLLLLTHPQQWPQILSPFGFLVPLYVVFKGQVRMVKPIWSTIWIFPVAFVSNLLFGVIIEVRVFGDLIPFAGLYLATAAAPFISTPRSFRS